MVALEAIVGAGLSAVLLIVKTIWEFLGNFGFYGYWVATMAIFFIDINTNLLGTFISLFTKSVGIEFTSLILFALTLFGGLTYLLVQSRFYLRGGKG